MGAHHARVVAADLGICEVLVADVHPERAEAVAARVGGKAIRREDAMAGSLDVGWVVVATPTAHHGESRAWAEAGARVLVEKPLAADLATARGLVHPRVRVGHIERHNPAWLACRPTGIRDLRARRVVARPLSEAPGRDVVTDLLIHDLDLLGLQAAGPLELVDVQGTASHHVVVEVRGPGLRATLEAGLGTHDGASRRWEGVDQQGGFVLDLVDGRAWREGHVVNGPRGDALTAQWRAFRGGGGVSSEQGLRALELAMSVLSRLAEPGDGAAALRELHDG